MKPEKKLTRRQMLRSAAQAAGAIGAAAVIGKLTALHATAEPRVWQLDPEKCVACGLCATECVLPTSAVKCVHAFDICGYCDYCTGFLEVYAQECNQAAENQLCPTNAIIRRFVHEPYFEYEIDVERCVGCGKCVEGCRAFGNASLYLQVFHDRCVNCNQCRIATVCPAMAFERVPASQPYKARKQYFTPPKPADGEAT
ncbi:MAG: 4Fe-4S binding protein [Phycisphaerae bacterium]|nr:4Fe-4S binding protein [Phycisphaerae bacterium]